MNENINENLRSIDQYEILQEIGRGGTSVVYFVADRADGRTYAMKVLRGETGSKTETSQQTAERLRAETAEGLRVETAERLRAETAEGLRVETAERLRAETAERLRAETADQLRAEAADQLRAEAEVLKALCSAGQGDDDGCRSIPGYIEGVCDENGEFAGFVMEYVEGRSLQQILEEGRRYSVREAAEAGVQVCAVLERLHRMDPPMIYRDMKPANILVRADGTWVLVDFGAVRKYRTGAGRDTDRLGTEGYAAPEQYGGWEQSDERTDIYGIGAVLHHMITGRSPLETGLRPLEEFRTLNGEGQFARHSSGGERLPRNLAGGERLPRKSSGGERLRRNSTGGERLPRQYSYMAKILLRCCSVAPSMRYSSCAELGKALQGVIRMCEKAERKNGAAGISAVGTGAAGTDTSGIGAGGADGAGIAVAPAVRIGVRADRLWRKFTLLVGAAGVFLVCSGMLAVSSEEAGMKEYRILIENAQKETDLNVKTEGYRRAVRARPEEPEAHLAFLRELAEDYVITQEEKDALESAAFAENSFERMREKRPGEYARVEMELGWVYFACYEGGTEAARTAFENARRAAGRWTEGRKAAAAMGVVLSEAWTRERIGGWRELERVSIREAFRTGEGAYAAAVCKAAVTEIALFPDRYEEVGADEEVIKEVTEAAVNFADEAEKGRPRVPERFREELRAAVEALRREDRSAK